ncbi:PH domain-containing protein [Methylobacillus pratensis]
MMSRHVEAFRSKHLQAEEEIVAFTEGYIGKMMGSGKDAQQNGSIIITNKRAAFYRKGFFGEVIETIPLKSITSVERKSFMGHRTLRLHTSHDDLEFKFFDKNAEVKLNDAIEAGRQNSQSQSLPADSDPLEKIAKLAELRDKGILTEAEFQGKKQQLLEGV